MLPPLELWFGLVGIVVVHPVNVAATGAWPATPLPAHIGNPAAAATVVVPPQRPAKQSLLAFQCSHMLYFWPVGQAPGSCWLPSQHHGALGLQHQ